MKYKFAKVIMFYISIIGCVSISKSYQIDSVKLYNKFPDRGTTASITSAFLHPERNNVDTSSNSVFLELLERQFPIESTERPLQLKTAQDYANSLAVHVNYLNRSVKEITGKPTTTHITERIISEAKALLQHTDWNIADVAYALGFEYPTYFNNFFKKMTGTNPKSLRAQEV
jgi:AraC family transcriptional regulator, transcriptional activator of pobA